MAMGLSRLIHSTTLSGSRDASFLHGMSVERSFVHDSQVRKSQDSRDRLILAAPFGPLSTSD